MTNILPFTGVSRPSPAFPAGMETSERDFYAESLQADPVELEAYVGPLLAAMLFGFLVGFAPFLILLAITVL